VLWGAVSACGQLLRFVTGGWYSEEALPPPPLEPRVSPRNFQGQYSDWPWTAAIIICLVFLLAILND